MKNLIYQMLVDTPEKFRLSQNYPNPFNPVTTLQYDLAEDGLVNITVYDMLGNVMNNLVNEYQFWLQIYPMGCYR